MLIAEIIAAFILLALHYYLCTLRSPWWGWLLPIIFLIGNFYLFISGKSAVNFQTLMLLIVGELVLIYGWVEGRNAYHKKQH